MHFEEMSIASRRAKEQNRIARRVCIFRLLRSLDSVVLSAAILQKVYADVFWLLLAIQVVTLSLRLEGRIPPGSVGFLAV